MKVMKSENPIDVLILTSYQHPFVIDEYSEIKKKHPNVILTGLLSAREILPVLLSNLKLLLLNIKPLIKCMKIISSNLGTWSTLKLVNWYLNLLHLIILDKKNEIRIIHAHWAYPAGVIAATYSQYFKKKLIITTHGFDEDYRTFDNEKLSRIVIRTLLSANWVIVGYKKSYDDFLKRGIKNLILASYFIDLSKFENLSDKLEERKKLGINSETFVVVFGPWLKKIYGVTDFVEVIKQVHGRIDNLLVICLGDGEMKSYVTEHFSKCKIDYKMIGKIPHSEAIRYLNACDVFCSLVNDRHGGMILESFACSRPVVAYDVSKGIIENGVTGLLANIGDKNSVAELILKLHDEPALGTRLGSNAKRKVDTEFSKQRRIDAILDSYR